MKKYVVINAKFVRGKDLFYIHQNHVSAIQIWGETLRLPRGSQS